VSWDHDGNRLTYQGVTYTYNMDDSIATAGSTSFTYFPTGARRTDGGHFYCYDGYDRLFRATAVTDVGCNSPTISYAYEGLDRQRAHSEGSGTTFMEYDGLSSTISAEYLGGGPSGAGTVYALAGSRRTAVGTYASGGVQASSINYLADDGIGNISTAVTTGGSMACTAWSDAWGVPMSPLSSSNPCNTGSTIDTSFYTGSRRDQITGDYQFGVRTYDPKTGSFLEPDTFLGSRPGSQGSVVSDPLTLNRYVYVNGDPLNLIDPSGHITCRRGNPDPNCDIYIDGGGTVPVYDDTNQPGGGAASLPEPPVCQSNICLDPGSTTSQSPPVGGSGDPVTPVSTQPPSTYQCVPLAIHGAPAYARCQPTNKSSGSTSTSSGSTTSSANVCNSQNGYDCWGIGSGLAGWAACYPMEYPLAVALCTLDGILWGSKKVNGQSLPEALWNWEQNWRDRYFQEHYGPAYA
jgi:RHS repeat-associated protein